MQVEEAGPRRFHHNGANATLDQAWPSLDNSSISQVADRDISWGDFWPRRRAGEPGFYFGGHLYSLDAPSGKSRSRCAENREAMVRFEGFRCELRG
jgi:hypothetical protein